MTDATRLREVTWQEVEQSCETIVRNLRNTQINNIVAIARGGIVPGAIIHQAFPAAVFNIVTSVSYSTLGTRLDQVHLGLINPVWDRSTTLVVDEIVDSGNTFIEIQRRLPRAIYASLFVRENTKFNPEYTGHIALKGEWLVFPWEKLSPDPGPIF